MPYAFIGSLGQRLVSFVVGVLRLEPVRSGQYGSFAGIEYLTESLFGVTVNAAMGIANQVQSAVYSFVGNFRRLLIRKLLSLTPRAIEAISST